MKNLRTILAEEGLIKTASVREQELLDRAGARNIENLLDMQELGLAEHVPWRDMSEKHRNMYWHTQVWPKLKKLPEYDGYKQGFWVDIPTRATYWDVVVQLLTMADANNDKGILYRAISLRAFLKPGLKSRAQPPHVAGGRAAEELVDLGMPLSEVKGEIDTIFGDVSKGKATTIFRLRKLPPLEVPVSGDPKKDVATFKSVLSKLAKTRLASEVKRAAYPTYDAEEDEMLLRGWDEVYHDMSDEVPAYLKGGTLIIQDIMGFTPRVFEYSNSVGSVREAEKIVARAMKDARGNVDRLSPCRTPGVPCWEEQ